MDLRKALKIMKALKKVAERENHFYSLGSPVSVTISGHDAGRIVPDGVTTTDDGSLTIEKIDDDGVRITANPFKAEDKLWNGPNVIKDDHFRSMFASLYHDLIWGHADELSRKWNVGRAHVLSWGNGILYAVWLQASGDSILGRLEARIAWGVCEWSAPWWSRIKEFFHIVCVAAVIATSAGCGTPPDWTFSDAVGTNEVIKAMSTAPAEWNDGPEIKPTPAPDPAPAVAGDEVPFEDLKWTRGGFKGAGAKHADGVLISSLNVSGRGMTYKWTSGGCEALGAADRGDASCLACLFTRRGGSWNGGKFDWISTSRTSRSFENVRGGYHGWTSEDLDQADAFAFVIVSRDGRRRTNTIKQEAGKR